MPGAAAALGHAFLAQWRRCNAADARGRRRRIIFLLRWTLLKATEQEIKKPLGRRRARRRHRGGESPA
jgi:hypothetical protein